ncbi:SOUL family heme-binding protein [Rhodovulum kholense]|uniref:SOUL heme-binding protein n=1 Tax=Rhodovulum kholense TaxID=453584 RepID=A0A8E2VGV8_9RHOB|nr:heme-binding protein [Rhodovulum kholense]PTW44497.1 SOUL heme-binding protein [Rhodovulum kholense]
MPRPVRLSGPVFLSGLALAATLAANLVRADSYRGYPEVPYRAERQMGAVELRHYPARTIAEVIVDGTRFAAINRGFSELAHYIFGENAAGEKIAMTVPVGQTRTDRGWAIRFTMPEDATPETLPEPTKSWVRLRRLPPETLLVLRFSGRATAEKLNAAGRDLVAEGKARGLHLTGPARLMFYDDPFTMPWNRRNEVGYLVAP